MLLGQLETVVARRPAAALDPREPDWEVEFVMDDDERRRVGDREPAGEPRQPRCRNRSCR